MKGFFLSQGFYWGPGPVRIELLKSPLGRDRKTLPSMDIQVPIAGCMEEVDYSGLLSPVPTGGAGGGGNSSSASWSRSLATAFAYGVIYFLQ